MKAIILTYSPVTFEEENLLVSTNIFKLACNGHARNLNPNERIITDYNIIPQMLNETNEPIISIRDNPRVNYERVKYIPLEYKGATILSAVDYLILKQYTDILLIATNTVNNITFQNTVKQGINNLKNKCNIYQYSNGNFDLEIKTIKDFILN